MSRNLGDTSCRICNDAVRLDEQARPISERDTGAAMFPNYEGLLVANARCRNCDAKYLAWVDAGSNRRLNQGHWQRRQNDDREFVDLSFRSSFNDEPGPDDLPSRETLRRIHQREIETEAQRLRDQAAELSAEADRLVVRATHEESPWEAYRR